ncbi:MAG: hypothetical protein NVS2B7_37180 [Herpetosiphon sp.]
MNTMHTSTTTAITHWMQHHTIGVLGLTLAISTLITAGWYTTSQPESSVTSAPIRSVAIAQPAGDQPVQPQSGLAPAGLPAKSSPMTAARQRYLDVKTQQFERQDRVASPASPRNVTPAEQRYLDFKTQQFEARAMSVQPTLAAPLSAARQRFQEFKAQQHDRRSGDQ